MPRAAFRVIKLLFLVRPEILAMPGCFLQRGETATLLTDFECKLVGTVFTYCLRLFRIDEFLRRISSYGIHVWCVIPFFFKL
jgi:hypothetical protein